MGGHALDGHEGRPHYMLAGSRAVLCFGEGRIKDRLGGECVAKKAIHLRVSA